jgi:DNA-binding SARP family transcriptional activator
MLHVRLLGELAVEAEGRAVVLNGSWRMRSLLAWLALNPGAHLRGDLAARFWPDVLETSARASLRNALWALRRALGPAAEALAASRERVGLEGAWTDVGEFERLVAEGELEAAVALWSGEPLTGLDDDWAFEARDELNRRLAGVLARIASAAEARDDLEAALGWARRRVALDPLAEDAQRELIRLLCEHGDRAGAIEAYARLRERLRRELGISPSGATRELVERIRDEDSQATPVAAPARPARVPDAGTRWEPGAPFPLPPRLRIERSARFVGRRGELEALRSLLRRAREGGGPRLALVTGEAGIGKTRLAWELALEAQRCGAIVLQGSCEEEAIAPFEPFVEALSHWARVASADEVRARLGDGGHDLAALLPTLASAGAGTDAGSGPGLGSAERVGTGRYASFEAVAALLASLGGEAPVLLVVDDLHWADASSAALLRYVLRSRPETPLLVVATYRPGAIAADAPVAEALSRLHQDGLLERLALPGLDREQVDELVRSLVGATASEGLTAAVHAETEGNPFFVGEIARHLGEGVVAHRLVLPDSVRELIERRLSRLGEPCLRLLTVAALIGREFELGPLERASGLEPDALDEALEEAVRAGLVVELPGLEDRLAFTHTLIRRTIAARLTRSRRRRVHARLAEAIDSASRRDDAEYRVAYHLCEAGTAGDPDRAVQFAADAAQRATDRLAYADAVQLYTRALPLLAREDPRRRRMALKRALAFSALTHQYADAPRPGAIGSGGGAPPFRS